MSSADLAAPRRAYINIGQSKRVYFDDFDLAEVTLEDLALALSHENRYGGHTRRPYSVIEHLLLCDDIYQFDGGADPTMRLAILMHDAHEGIIKDMPSPHKRRLKDYRALENTAEVALHVWLGLPMPAESIEQTVKMIDLRALNTERVHFGFEPDSPNADWPSLITWPISHRAAEQLCLNDRKVDDNYIIFLGALRDEWLARVDSLLQGDHP